MKPELFSLVEQQLIIELVDAIRLGQFLNCLGDVIIDGHYLGQELQQMYDDEVLTTRCNQDIVNSLIGKFRSYNENQVNEMMSDYSGKGKIT